MSYGRQLLQLQPAGGSSCSIELGATSCTTCTLTCKTKSGTTVGTTTVSGCLSANKCYPCHDAKALGQDCSNAFPSQCPVVSGVPQCVTATSCIQ